MGSDAQAGAPPAAPAAQAAPVAGGGMNMALIALIVVVIVVVAAVVGYLVMTGDSGDSLSGQWTVSGGEIRYTIAVNNGTANTTTIPVPADSTVIDFDNPGDMPEGMVYHDLGGGEFEITSFEMMGADFGTIHGSYDINGDTMTLHFTASGTYIDGTDYMDIDMDYTVTFARA